MKAVSKYKEHVHIEGNIKIEFHNYVCKTENKQKKEILRKYESANKWKIVNERPVRVVNRIIVPKEIDSKDKLTIDNLTKPVDEYSFQELRTIAKNSQIKSTSRPSKSDLIETIELAIRARNKALEADNRDKEVENETERPG